MRQRVLHNLIENHRSQLYKLTADKGLNLNHPDVLKKSQELDFLIHVHNSLTLNREVDMKSVIDTIYKFKD